MATEEITILWFVVNLICSVISLRLDTYQGRVMNPNSKYIDMFDGCIIYSWFILIVWCLYT